jgi:DHA1 family inner membrane transport protein
MDDRDVSVRAIAAVAVLSLSTFAYVTTEALPIGLLTPIADSLGTTPAAAGLLVTGYGLVVVVLTVPLTRLARGVGRRRLLVGLLGILVLGTLGSAVASSYALLLSSRVLTAAAQALFWALVVPVGASLVPRRLRGRAVTLLFAGSSLAGVLGVPAGTWLGQQAGWRAAFLGMSTFALGLLVLVAVLLPSDEGAYEGAETGTRPDPHRYRLLLVTTALAVTGAYTAFTYVEPFLLQVSGLDAREVSPVLLVRGVAGVAGVALAALLVDRNAWLAGLLAVTLLATALLTQYLGGTRAVVAVAAVALSAAALAAFAAALGTRVLQLAPGSTDLAAAGSSTAFNVGITLGALLGSGLLTTTGLRSTTLAGFTVAALALITQLLQAPRSSGRRPAIPVPETLWQEGSTPAVAVRSRPPVNRRPPSTSPGTTLGGTCERNPAMPTMTNLHVLHPCALCATRLAVPGAAICTICDVTLPALVPDDTGALMPLAGS